MICRTDVFFEHKREKIWQVKKVSKEIGKLAKNLKELENWQRTKKLTNNLYTDIMMN